MRYRLSRRLAGTVLCLVSLAGCPATTQTSGSRVPVNNNAITLGPPLPRASTEVAEVKQPPLPTCSAVPAQTLAQLSSGVPSQPALAVRDDKGLIAFIVDANRDGNTELVVQALDAEGKRAGSPRTIATKPNASAPALIADPRDGATGFVLAWRHGTVGHEEISLVFLTATGAAVPNTQPITLFPDTVLGAPALFGTSDHNILVAAAENSSPNTVERQMDRFLFATIHSASDIQRIAWTAPDGSVLDGTLAPRFVSAKDPGSDTPRVRVNVLGTQRGALPGTERFLLELTPDAGRLQSGVLLRDVDAPSAMTTASGPALLAWRTPVSLSDHALRSRVFSGEDALQPALTHATYRHAFNAAVQLVELPRNLGNGLFTTSLATDDGMGSIDAALLTAQGDALGLQFSMVTTPMRSSTLVAASTSDATWLAFESRDTRGPALSLSRVTCNPANPVPEANIPPPGFVVQTPLRDTPSVSLARAATNATACTAIGEPQVIAQHFVQPNSPRADSVSKIVGMGRTSLAFVLARTTDSAGNQLVVATVDERGAVTHTRILALNVQSLLAATRVGNSAYVLFTEDNGAHTVMHRLNANGDTETATAIPVVDAVSGVIVDDNGTALLNARRPALPYQRGLMAVPLQSRATTAHFTQIASLERTDRVVDAVRVGSNIHVLLSRTDRLGAPTAQALSRVVLNDSMVMLGRGATQLGTDPASDVISVVHGPALLLGTGRDSLLVTTRDERLRTTPFSTAGLSPMRSAAQLYPLGGTELTRGHSGETAVLVATGFPENIDQATAPWSLMDLGVDGSVKSVMGITVKNNDAVPGGASFTFRNSALTLVYARVASDTEFTWLVQQAECKGRP